MSRKYSIGFIIIMLTVIACLFIIYQISYNEAHERHERERVAEEKALQTEGKAYKENGYMIMERDGYVIVFHSDMETVYEYTTIKAEHLPEDVREQISQGMYVENIKEVYGFLENYSS